jgi:methylthioribose-1-phosphate isomerase
VTEQQTVWWEDGRVRMIDQTRLPAELVILDLSSAEAVAEAIRSMRVRGAPAIGVAAGLGLALAAHAAAGESPGVFRRRLSDAGECLRGTRPTAVNLFWAIDRLLGVAEREQDPGRAAARVEAEARAMVGEDVRVNRAIGRHGVDLMPAEGGVLTHCNAGSLATVAYGTALGVIRAAVEAGRNLHVYVDETRPRLQGMKLTAWELQQDGILATIITDSMAGWVMRQGRVRAVIVGADRIAANGDTANKIGTYGLAVLAHAHQIPFYVAAPLSTIDFLLPDGGSIPIEERSTDEVTHLHGVCLAPEGAGVYNPAFDVTPAALITAIVTEAGVARSPLHDSLAQLGESGWPRDESGAEAPPRCTAL